MIIMDGVAADYTFKSCFFAKKSEIDLIKILFRKL